MSVFDKLKAYSRKPAAVILATVMVTSTIPTTPIAQAVTAAYADAGTTQQSGGTPNENTKAANFDASGLVSDVKDWNFKDPLTLDASQYIKEGDSFVKAKATITSQTIKNLVNTELQKANYDSVFNYKQGDKDDAYSSAIDDALNAKLKELNEDSKNKENKITFNSIALDGAVSRDVTGYTVQVFGPDGAEIAPKDGNYVVTADTTLKNPGKVTVKVNSVSLSLSFNYKVQGTKTITNTKPVVIDKADGKSDVSDSNKDKPLQQNGNTGNTDTGGKTEEPVNSNGAIKAKMTKQKDISSANVVLTSGDVNVNEIYAGVKESIPANYTVPENDCPTYKTDHDAYTVLQKVPQGIKGTIDEKTAGFNASMSTTDADESQAVKVDKDKNDAFSEAKTITIKWTYPDNTEAGTTTFTLPKINQKELDLSGVTAEDQIDFRMATDQDKYLKDAANKAAKKAIEDTKTGDEVSDFYKSASIKTDDYSDYYANASAYRSNTLDKTKLTLERGDNAILKNYAITGQPTVVVKAMESKAWSEGSSLTKKLSLSGTGLKDETFDSPSKTWIKTTAKAIWADGKIINTREGLNENTKFAGSTDDTYRGGQGKMENSFYVQDDGDKIVREITGTSYLFDNARPGLTSFKAVPVGKSFKSADKKVWAAENMKVQFYTTEGDTKGDNTNDNDNVCASGINKVEGTYTEHSSKGKSTEQPIPSNAFDKTKDKYGYEFNISADSKVNANDIHVKLTDNAGNESGQLGVSNAKANDIDVEELAATTTAPTISTSWNTTAASNGKYYNVNRTLTVTIHAPFFEYTQAYLSGDVFATITKNGGSYRTLTPSDFKSQGNDTWVATVDFTEDGDYEVSNVNVQDILGRGSTADGDTFTIDKTAPKLNVSWNNEAASNGKYYNAARTATITVEEHNFDPNLFKIEAPVNGGNGSEATPAQIGGWSSNGDTHTATVTFPGQGVYSLSVSGEDLATNKSESYTSPEFVIDTIKPKIDIQNVINRTAYAGDVAPSAAVHDTNLADGTTIEVSKISYPLSKDDPNPYAGAAINTSATDKSVSYLNPAKTKGNDGVYTLTVQAVDLAGNTESEAVTWSVNRFGSTYVISDKTGKMLDKYLKSDKTVDVKVTEINPSGLDDNKTAVELTHDTKNSTLKNGDNYTTDSDTTSGWSEYNYTVKKGNYGKDGAYRVLFHSQDTAGNSSENTMQGKNAKKSGSAAEINFAVDDTAPIASFIDLDNNGKYEESSHKAKVSFEDNLKLAKAQIKVNGKVVATFTGDQLEKNPVREFTLDGSSSKQDVSVVAWDAAGNRSKELKATGVLVTNDSLVLWMNNLPMMIGTIAAVVIVAGGIWFVVAKKRKENEGEEA